MADGYRILGCVESASSQPEKARQLFEKSIALNRDTGYLLGEADSKRDFAIHLEPYRTAQAVDLFNEARGIFKRLGATRETDRIDQRLSNKRRESDASCLDGRSGLPPREVPIPSNSI